MKQGKEGKGAERKTKRGTPTKDRYDGSDDEDDQYDGLDHHLYGHYPHQYKRRTYEDAYDARSHHDLMNSGDSYNRHHGYIGDRHNGDRMNSGDSYDRHHGYIGDRYNGGDRMNSGDSYDLEHHYIGDRYNGDRMNSGDSYDLEHHYIGDRHHGDRMSHLVDFYDESSSRKRVADLYNKLAGRDANYNHYVSGSSPRAVYNQQLKY